MRLKSQTRRLSPRRTKLMVRLTFSQPFKMVVLIIDFSVSFEKHPRYIEAGCDAFLEFGWLDLSQYDTLQLRIGFTWILF